MNKVLKNIALILMLLSTPSLAKDNKSDLESLSTTLKSYKEVQINGNLEKTIDYIYPPVFTITSKEMLLQGFKMAKDSGKMPKITKFSIENSKVLKSYSKGVYIILPYSVEMDMDLTPSTSKENKEAYAKEQEMLTDPKKVGAYKEFTVNMLKMSMGQGVEINSKKGSMMLNIKKSSNLLGIKENTSSWKFIDADPMVLTQMKAIVPKDIVANEKELFSANVPNPAEQLQQMMEMMKQN